jgi:hypothetical protein
MKLVYKGIFKNNEQLSKSDLPQNSVKFKEPDSLLKVNLIAMLFLIPAYAGIELLKWLSSLLYAESTSELTELFFIFLPLLVLPHEFLHAICFGKEAKVELYIAPPIMAFIYSTHPLKKSRFILTSLLPNMVLGWFPLFVWAILPYNEVYSNNLYTFAVVGILVGIADYLNVFNALCQMPKGSIHQASGINSYWFLPSAQ